MRVVGVRGVKRVGGVRVSGRRSVGVRCRLSRPRWTLRSVIGRRWMLVIPGFGVGVRVWVRGVVRGEKRPREMSSAEGRGGVGLRI